MLGNTSLFLIDFDFWTLDYKLAIVYKFAVENFLENTKINICSHSLKMLENKRFRSLESYLLTYCFNWFYGFMQMLYDTYSTEQLLKWIDPKYEIKL